MDTFTTPFQTTLHQAGEQAVAAQKQVLDYSRTQMKLAEQQALSNLSLGKAGFDASAELAMNASKSMLAAFAPKAPAEKV